jgi:hypothetical protein
MAACDFLGLSARYYRWATLVGGLKWLSVMLRTLPRAGPPFASEQ